LKSEGKRFSPVFDKWTSASNRRHLNVNLHSAGRTLWNVGLVGVNGNVAAENSLELAEIKIGNLYPSFFKDIICVTDGA
jgi:hypothetical protein